MGFEEEEGRFDPKNRRNPAPDPKNKIGGTFGKVPTKWDLELVPGAGSQKPKVRTKWDLEFVPGG